MRLFIGIFPPKEYQEYFRDILREFNKQKGFLSFSNVEQIHITLKFIGPFVSERSKDLIVDNLRNHEHNFGGAQVILGKVRYGFDKQSDPKIVIADVLEDKSIVDLASNVHSLIKELHLLDTYTWKDKHSEDFHFTVARQKRSGSKEIEKQLRQIVSSISIPKPEPFFAKEMFLVQSELTNKGPIYRKIEKFIL